MKDLQTQETEDRICIETWKAFLVEFKLMFANKEADFSKYVALKERAKNNPHLTYHQKDAIAARCDNVMNGTYGNTKRPEHFLHSEKGK